MKLFLFAAPIVFLVNIVGCVATPPSKPLPLPTWKNSMGMRFVSLPGGSFRMGHPDASYGGSHIHKVTVSPFWIGQYEVTNAQFKLFRAIKQFPQFAGATQPASAVRWVEAREFCRWLSKRDGLKYRLPTEAEWEYAARGGLDQKEFPWGDEDPDGRAIVFDVVTVPVGSFAPNRFGLYDMAGNVNEYVNDYFSEDYYKISPEKDPQGPRQTDPMWIKKPARTGESHGEATLGHQTLSAANASHQLWKRKILLCQVFASCWK